MKLVADVVARFVNQLRQKRDLQRSAGYSVRIGRADEHAHKPIRECLDSDYQVETASAFFPCMLPALNAVLDSRDLQDLGESIATLSQARVAV